MRNVDSPLWDATEDENPSEAAPDPESPKSAANDTKDNTKDNTKEDKENENDNENDNENEDNKDEDEDENMGDGSMEDGSQEDEKKKKRKARTKIDFNFFKPPKVFDPLTGVETESTDRLWDLFLDVAGQFPTLEEQMEISGETNKQNAIKTHLNLLLSQLRHWSQVNHQSGHSLLGFAEKFERLSVKTDFYDYRAELISKYKSTNWKEEITRRKIQASAPAPDDSQHEELPPPQQAPTQQAPPQPSSSPPELSAATIARIRAQKEQAAARRQAREQSQLDQETLQRLQQKRAEALERQRKRLEQLSQQ